MKKQTMLFGSLVLSIFVYTVHSVIQLNIEILLGMACTPCFVANYNQLVFRALKLSLSKIS